MLQTVENTRKSGNVLICTLFFSYAIRRILRDCNEDALMNAKGKKEPILLPAFSCHTLRHTCVSMLIHCNVNPNVVKEYMGHASLETTIDVSTDVMKEAMQRSFGLAIDQDIA